MSKPIIVYTVTVIDVNSDTENPLGFQKTPAIFTSLERAIYTVSNNDCDLADGGTYQYAVIESNNLNEVRPLLNCNGEQHWFKFNSVLDEFEKCIAPKQFTRISGFGIG